jgi:prolyl-tRNA editing enzyme YbaK/EbsC (Cys-tRNA(Pro) deacylase)
LWPTFAIVARGGRISFESVRAWLSANAPDLRLIEAHASTATVADAAETLGVAPGQIA